jgi:hypothetical protein
MKMERHLPRGPVQCPGQRGLLLDVESAALQIRDSEGQLEVIASVPIPGSDAIADLGQPAVHGESTEGKPANGLSIAVRRYRWDLAWGSSSYGHNSAVGVGTGTTITPPPRGEYLRLQFNKDDKAHRSGPR